MSKNKIKINDIQGLINMCPYKLSGNTYDQEALEVVEQNDALFVISSNTIFSTKNIEDYWYNQLYLHLKLGKLTEFKLSEEFVLIGQESFLKLYKTKHPELNQKQILVNDEVMKSDADIGDLFDSTDKMYWFKGHPDVEYKILSDYGRIIYFIENRIFPRFLRENSSFEIIETAHKFGSISTIILRKVEGPQSSDVIEVCKHILLKMDEMSESIDVLIHLLNTSDFELNISKPISRQFLAIKLINQPDYFCLLHKGSAIKDYNSVNASTIVKLNDFITPFVTKLVEESQPANHYEENKIQECSGLFALVYTGNDFPLKSANAYINIRPIIYVGYSAKIKHSLLDIININASEDLRFYSLLEAIFSMSSLEDEVRFLPSDELYEKIESNFRFSYIEMPAEEAKTLVEAIEIRYAPILNLDNPGNIFANDIKELVSKYEEFTKQNGQ